LVKLDNFSHFDQAVDKDAFMQNLSTELCFDSGGKICVQNGSEKSGCATSLFD